MLDSNLHFAGGGSSLDSNLDVSASQLRAAFSSWAATSHGGGFKAATPGCSDGVSCTPDLADSVWETVKYPIHDPYTGYMLAL